jgi:peptidoglycan-associated lipoprotein
MEHTMRIPTAARLNRLNRLTRATRTAAPLLALSVMITLSVMLTMIACGGKKPPVARPVPPPPPQTSTTPKPPAPPEPVAEPTMVPPEPVKEDKIAAASLDDLNRSSPLKPLFFAYDSAEVDGPGQAVLDANAAILKQYPSWTVTIEGHCDERGTAEYNLALGERRAVAARTYLLSLGVSADRLRTVSYGKEFPFDPGHDDAAWTKNRRAHFVITAK